MVNKMLKNVRDYCNWQLVENTIEYFLVLRKYYKLVVSFQSLIVALTLFEPIPIYQSRSLTPAVRWFFHGEVQWFMTTDFRF
jgi:hypothetical protein